MSFKARVADYFSLNVHLLSMKDMEIENLLKKGKAKIGWGLNQTVLISGKKVFVKRISLTRVEYENLFSTKNHFNLPVYYNFGVGSAGFGAFRELIGHLKTTAWVLNGELENFPLMYHYRILRNKKRKTPIRKSSHNEYVKSWNGNRNISRYVLARNQAPYEIVLFLEHFPYTVRTWLPNNTEKYSMLVEDIKKTTHFLRSKKVLHFDLHTSNIVTDGKRAYVTDFGLYLDKKFDFSKEEKKFFNKYLKGRYDYYEFLCGIGYAVLDLYFQLPKAKKKKLETEIGVKMPELRTEAFETLFEHLEKIYAMRLLKANSRFLKFLISNKSTILKVADFYSSLRANPKKNNQYPKIRP